LKNQSGFKRKKTNPTHLAWSLANRTYFYSHPKSHTAWLERTQPLGH